LSMSLPPRIRNRLAGAPVPFRISCARRHLRRLGPSPGLTSVQPTSSTRPPSAGRAATTSVVSTMSQHHWPEARAADDQRHTILQTRGRAAPPGALYAAAEARLSRVTAYRSLGT